MCFGIPMQVIEAGEFSALCRGHDSSEQVDLALVGPQPEGAWLLVFLGAAREVLTAEDAGLIASALEALSAVARGETNVDHLFPDLTGAHA